MIQELIDQYKKGEVLCLVDLAMRIIGGKWKPIILWHLGNNTVLRYGELKKNYNKYLNDCFILIFFK